MTPNELSLYVEACNEKKQHEQEEQLTYVWLGERIHRMETLISLNEFLGKEESVDQGMTDDQMLAKVRALNAMFGGDTQSIVKDGEINECD